MISWFEKRAGTSWIITLGIAIAIFYISSLQFKGGTSTTSILSVLYHFFVFFFLAGFLLISSVRGEERYLIFFLAIILLILYGISDELHQFFVPGRTSSLFDVFLNTLGIISASLVYFVSLLHRKKVYIVR